jgi:hypothetical protein
MFALLQIYPPEALDLDWRSDCGVEVLAVGDTEEQLEQFAADYKQRHRAANQQWTMWDDLGREWDAAHDHKIAELEVKYRGHGNRGDHILCDFLAADPRSQMLDIDPHVLGFRSGRVLVFRFCSQRRTPLMQPERFSAVA